MKITTVSVRSSLFFLAVFLSMQPPCLLLAGEDTVSLTLLDVSLESALTELARQTERDIVYSDDLVKGYRVSCTFENLSIEQALGVLLNGTPITFRITHENQIVLIRHIAALQQRISIRGVVRDQTTGLPLGYVNVFLANTMMGSATNLDGEFLIEGVPAGTFDLVASRLGYEVKISQLVLAGPLNDRLTIELIPKPYQTPEIQISAKRIDAWNRDFRTFKELFFSTTANADECAITNSHVLQFSQKEHGLFVVEALEPLTIENSALGYKLYYVLEEFSASRHLITMRGFARFEELTPASREEEQKWKRGRLKAYNGSLKHFLATLCRNYGMPGTNTGGDKNALKDSGFSVWTIDSPWERRDKHSIGNSGKILRLAETSDKLALAFPEYLLINYRNEVADESYMDYEGRSQFSREQESIINLTTDSVLIDTSGNVYDNNGLRVDQCGIRTSGYWSWERMADRLPWDYTAASAEADARALGLNQ